MIGLLVGLHDGGTPGGFSRTRWGMRVGCGRARGLCRPLTASSPSRLCGSPALATTSGGCARVSEGRIEQGHRRDTHTTGMPSASRQKKPALHPIADLWPCRRGGRKSPAGEPRRFTGGAALRHRRRVDNWPKLPRLALPVLYTWGLGNEYTRTSRLLTWHN